MGLSCVEAGVCHAGVKGSCIGIYRCLVKSGVMPSVEKSVGWVSSVAVEPNGSMGTVAWRWC